MIHYTFAGQAWYDLRPDQQEYVQHLMLSWRAACPVEYWKNVLNKAVKRAKEQMP